MKRFMPLLPLLIAILATVAVALVVGYTAPPQRMARIQQVLKGRGYLRVGAAPESGEPADVSPEGGTS